jgi:hypothetical protein
MSTLFRHDHKLPGQSATFESRTARNSSSLSIDELARVEFWHNTILPDISTCSDPRDNLSGAFEALGRRSAAVTLTMAEVL